MSGAARLSPQPPLLDLGPYVRSAGFATADAEAVIAALESKVPEAPPRAVAKRRAEYMAGRWAAREALSRLGIDATPGRTESGLPIWPREVSGSITHGAQRALAAVARTAEVRSLGIDAERLMATASAELCARICAEPELVELEQVLRRPRPHALTVAFSAKESLYKCLHPLVGKFMDFHAARVVEARSVRARAEGGELVGELTLELSVDWSPELRRGRTFRAEFVCALSHIESAVILRA